MDSVAEEAQQFVEPFLSAESFTEILRLVSKFRRHMVADLTLYDIALRIGAGRGMLPQEVYLQCGAKTGARAVLGLKAVRGERSLPISAFPSVLQRLQPYELENFLCYYRKELGQPPSRTRPRRRVGC